MDETNDQTGVPQITGISPKEGTPGTTVTLRGEHLGTEQSDLLGLFICGTDCLVSAKWKSTSKIIARLGQAKRGLGEIVLITKSGGKGVSNVQFRVFIEQVQPLQDSSVWVDESRTVPGRNVVRQVQENTDTTDALGFPLNKNTEDHTYLTKLFPESSGNLRMENFNASWYLLEHHKNSSIEQLREGQRNMKAKMISEEKKGKDMHKANLYSLINCVDAVDSLHAKLKIERNTRGWPLTNNLNDKVTEAKKTACRLFLDVLGRKDKADATRNALSVLTRFRVIFFLSSTIDENLKKGEYTAILNDYTRVKALFKDTDVSLFNEAMAVVDEKIRKISNTVKHKLIEAPTSFEEQSKLIKFLKYRDPDSDPAYDAIAAYHVWLEDIFWQIQDKYYTMAMEEYEQQKNGISLSDSISSNYLTIANTRQQFCVELMNVLTDKLQMFFKLSQDYVTTNDKEYTKKQENIYQMIFNNINTVSWLLCNALCPQFLPGDIRKSMAKDFVQWPADLHVISVANQATQLINSLKPIRVCIKTFQDASFANGQLEPLMELCTTIRVYSFNEIIQSTCSKIVALNSQETWKTDVVYDQMTKTSLPDLFENEIYDVLPMMKQLISCDNYEGEKDLSLDEKYKTIVLELLLSTVVSIKECYIAMLQLKSNQENKRPNHLQLAGNRELNGSFSSLQSDSMDNRSTGSSDTVNQSSTTISFAGSSNLSSRKMLICICNLDYIATHSLATICKRFRDNGIKYTELILEKAKTRLLNFRQSLLKFYLSLKMSTFSNLLTVNAYDLPPEDDVSSYVKEIIIGMVFIKADLVLLAPQIIVPLMERAVKECTDKLFGLISEFQITSEDFACQLVIDLTGIEEAFQEFLDLQTKSNLNAMRANLVGRFDQTKFQRCLKRWRSNMAMAVAGLQSAEFVEDEANIYINITPPETPNSNDTASCRSDLTTTIPTKSEDEKLLESGVKKEDDFDEFGCWGRKKGRIYFDKMLIYWRNFIILIISSFLILALLKMFVQEQDKAKYKRLQIILFAQFGMFIGSTVSVRRIILLTKQSHIYVKAVSRSITILICLLAHFSFLTFYLPSSENSTFITTSFLCFSIFLHFNILILTLLFAELAIYGFTYYCLRSPPRRIPDVPKNVITIAGIIFAIILTIHGFTVTSSPYTIKKVDILVRQLPIEFERFSIVLLTDVHIGPSVYKDRVDKMVAAVNTLNPHMVAISGDLVDGYVQYVGERVKSLNNLKSKYGTFYVTGNHEYYQDNVENWMDFFTKNINMTILRNENKIIRRNEAALCVAGVDDIYSTKLMIPGHLTDATKALANCPENSTNILLVHQPNAAKAILLSENRTKRVDLTLSGHTHGGQFYVTYLFTRLMNAYVSGLHTVTAAHEQIYISAGTHFWGPASK